MKICFLAQAEEEYEPKIRYVVELFFSTYGLDYQPIKSLHQLFEAKSPPPDLLLVYGNGEDYQDLKEKIPPGCHLFFVSKLVQQALDPRPPQVKRLKQEGTDFSLPILYAYPTPKQKCYFLVEEKSGRRYPGISIEKSDDQMRIACFVDFFASSFYLLTLQEEKEGYEKNGGARFLAQESWRDKENALQIPLVNHYFKILFELIQMVAKEKGVPLIYKKFWPSGSNLAVALTHDVDILDKWSFYALFRMWTLLKRGDFKALIRMLSKLPRFLLKGNKSLHGTGLILEQEKTKDFNSTFFFLAGKSNLKTILRSDITYSVNKTKPVVEQILNSQGEVGLHGSRNSHLKKKELMKEKESLNKFLPSPCTGIRQHFLFLKAPQTWRFQSESGFLYDCTLGFPDRSGFRSGFALPFQPYDLQTDKEIGIWEINTNVMDQTYDKYDRKGKGQIKREIEKLQDQLESAGGGLLTLLWHTNVLEEFGFSDFLDLYGELLEDLSQKEAFVSTGENIVRFWKARKEVKLLKKELGNNLWRWIYQTASPIADLTFCLNLPSDGKFRIQVDGAKALIKTDMEEALITFPGLDQKQDFQISLINEEP